MHAPRREWAPTRPTTTVTRGSTWSSPRSPTIATRCIATSTAANSRTPVRPAGIAGPTFGPDGLGRSLLRRRPGRQARSVLRQRPHLLGHRPVPAAGGNLPPEEPVAAEHRDAIPRRFGTRREWPAGSARRARPRRRRPRQRWRSRRRHQQRGQHADAPGESADARTITGWRCASPPRGQSIRHRREGRRSLPVGRRRCARSVPAGASSRRAICGRTSASADYAGPVDVEVRMPGGRRWQWKQLPADRLHTLTLSESASIPKTGVAR